VSEGVPEKARFWPTTAAYQWQAGFQRFLLSFKEAAQYANFFGGAAALELEKKALHDLHHRAIGYLHSTLNGESRRNFIRTIDAFAQTFGAPPVELPAEPAGWAGCLDEEGYALLPPLDADRIDKLRARLEDCLMTSWSGDVSGRSEDLRGRANLGVVAQRDILQIEPLVRLGLEPAVLAAARAHLGAAPLLLDVAAWKSFADPDRARDAQLFHYDLDDYRFCKLFIYLTDVDDGGGPHVYLPGSHRPETVAAVRPPEEDTAARAAFDEWYFKTLRKSDADTVRWFGRDPIRLTGGKGARFLVNTEGLHKGEPPAAHDRWILQFEYGVSAFTQWGGAFDAPLWTGGGDAERYAAQLLFREAQRL